MNTNLSPIAETARVETATETLAEYIDYLNSEIDAEQDKAEPNAQRVDGLTNLGRLAVPLSELHAGQKVIHRTGRHIS
jgi:hypothetical protein